MDTSHAFRNRCFALLHDRGVRADALPAFRERYAQLVEFLTPCAPCVWTRSDLVRFVEALQGVSLPGSELESFVLLADAAREALELEPIAWRSIGRQASGAFDRLETSRSLPVLDDTQTDCFMRDEEVEAYFKLPTDSDFLAENQQRWLRERAARLEGTEANGAASSAGAFAVTVDPACGAICVVLSGPLNGTFELAGCVRQGLALQERSNTRRWMLDLREAALQRDGDGLVLERWLEEGGRDGVRALAVVVPAVPAACAIVQRLVARVRARAARHRLRIRAFADRASAEAWLSRAATPSGLYGVVAESGVHPHGRPAVH